MAEEDKVVSIGVRKGFELLENMNTILETKVTKTVRDELMTAAIANAPSEE